MVLTPPRQNAVLYILNPLYTSLSYFVFNLGYLCSSCSSMVTYRTCIHSIDLSWMFVPHSRDFLKNLGDFTRFYRTSFIVPPTMPRIKEGEGGGEFFSHQAGKGKVNFQEPGLGNFQEGEDGFNQAGSCSFIWIIY